MKKIVVLTGSPREEGNSNAMAKAFIEAARAKGHSVKRFDTAKLFIGGCRACMACYARGNPCIFGDDFNEIGPAILEADGVAFVMPLYWYSIPSNLKAAIDKMFAFFVGGRDVSGKTCALIVCCAEDDAAAMDGVRIAYERSAGYMKWKSVGTVLIPGVLEEGDIRKTDGCERAAELADRF